MSQLPPPPRGFRPAVPAPYSHRPVQQQHVPPIRQALADTRGRKSEAAKKLGISRSTLWRKMKSLGLVPPR